ncbi:CYTH and CHAD domain-containing protein [Actinomadura harenae]|uniref:CHAD domain-containing protein n=1 Tax=Actinomadura harenae TaxID=2483351 RepID=A0A3M2MCS0_9ACTN|nr:CYTH and CHAD domain-containing protein [Actinomadura harenae]RMI47377.1 CHAD domain-containing protein [Actinomadura harenae]
MTESHLEIERKYDAAADFTLPDLSGLPGVEGVRDAASVRLHAAYFDTADLRLAARGITLRRRRGGEDAGWHLKLPAPAGRLEVRAPLGRARSVPGRLASLVAAYTRGAPLRQVAALDTDRRTTLLLDADGAPLAEVADDAVVGTVLDAEAVTTRWREVEVELVNGPPKLLAAAGRRLRKAGARESSASSKLARLLDGRIERRGGVPKAEAKGRCVGDVVVARLSAQVDALLRHDPAARRGEDDAVHQMRVAARRARAVLRAYAPLFERERVRPIGDELRWLGGVLGEVRDLEVLRARLTKRVGELAQADPAAEPVAAERVAAERVAAVPSWLDDLARQERAAYRRMNAALGGLRYFALLDALDALVAEPPLTARARRPADEEFPGLLDRSRRRLVREHDVLTGDPEDVETARHDVRKAAKRVRYAAETAVPVLGADAERAMRDAKAVQTALGEHRDALITMRRIEEIAAAVRDPAEAFALGRIHEVERRAADASLTRFAAAWNA